MRRSLRIIFVVIFMCIWRFLFWGGGIDCSSSYPDVEDKMVVNHIEKGCQKESIKTQKGRADFEVRENIQSRSIIEEKRGQTGPNYLLVATTGSSIFVIALVLIFCARKNDDDEDQTVNDESFRLTETQIECGEPKDLERGGSFLKHESTNSYLVNNDGQEGATPPAASSGPAAAGPPPPPAGPPPPPPPKPRAPPAPPLRGGRAPPPPPKGADRRKHSSSHGGEGSNDDDNQRTRLKPFFWDKVLASPEHSMVWDEIKAGSFQFNEEMIESLFGYNPEEKKNSDRRGRQANTQATFIQIIDSRKAQNLAILLKALNVTTQEVHDALLEGHELPAELLQTLIRMAPTSEEELKLRLYSGDMSQIGTAERFLKSLVEIPFAFRRMECLLFIMTIKEEASGLKEAFCTLEVACNKLRNSRLFLKILEAVLKTGNRMNDGTYRGGAQAFKLDTLLKLADVKGTDGKTTLLHFVIQEIIRTEGIKAAQALDSMANVRAVGLQIVSNLTTELDVIKKAAIIDSDALTSTAAKLGQSLLKTKDFLNREMQNLGEESRFYLALKDFVEESEGEITWLLQEERRVIELVKKTVDYFHGNSSKDEGLRLFVVVRDFLTLLDRICVEIQKKMEEEAKAAAAKLPKSTSSSISHQSSTGKKQILDGDDGVLNSTSKEASETPPRRIINDDNGVLSLLRTYSLKEKSKDDVEFLSLLRTYSVRERPMNQVQTSSPLTTEKNEVSLISETSSSPESDVEASLINEEQKEIVITQEKVIEDMRKKLFPVIQGSLLDESSSSSSDDDDDKSRIPTEVNLANVSSQEKGFSEESSMQASHGDGKEKKIVINQERVNMRNKLSVQDESGSTSSDDDHDDDKSQIPTKVNLANVPTQESKGFSEESSMQASHDDDKEIKEVCSQQKVMDDIQHRLFKMIQDRRFEDDDSSSSSSGDEN